MLLVLKNRFNGFLLSTKKIYAKNYGQINAELVCLSKPLEHVCISEHFFIFIYFISL